MGSETFSPKETLIQKTQLFHMEYIFNTQEFHVKQLLLLKRDEFIARETTRK